MKEPVHPEAGEPRIGSCRAHSCCFKLTLLLRRFKRWGTADAEIKSPTAEIQEQSKVLSSLF